MFLAQTDSATDPTSSLGFVVTRPAAVVLVVLTTWLLVRVARFLIHRVVRRVADRSLADPGSTWRGRVPRLFPETTEQAELRRRQRVDAVSRMCSRMFSMTAWLAALLVILHLLDISPLLLLSSAGFLGAGLAIGGQHQVRDWLAGLTILVEDRFGVGDEIEVESPTGGQVRGIVAQVGSFTTRLRDGHATWHLANGSLGQVRNLSQLPAVSELDVTMPDLVGGDAERAGTAIADAVRRAAGGPALTGVILVDDVRAAGDADDGMKVELRTTRPLTSGEQQRLQEVVEDELDALARGKLEGTYPRR